MSIDGDLSEFPHHLNNQEPQSPVYSHPKNAFHLSSHTNSGHETQILFLIIATGTIIVLFILIIIICVKKNKYLQSHNDQHNVDCDSPNTFTSEEIKEGSLSRNKKVSGNGKKNGFFRANELKNDHNFTVPTIVITTASLKRKNYKDEEFDF
ncbi:Hypothetical protein SRAE_1000035300 [Strongyloides ratti]|uniref:Uncharacterized protein n=1 Tax=Strongyloides ratti TaxID=34506 RepID=A0A090L3L4_STRRB|nr:Hypothetical protein SRAE_1000035300 [Strongyloides ratti]CEF62079.1 Hypothetical protein SRAE_1000035300 [Strongyloides ratti]